MRKITATFLLLFLALSGWCQQLLLQGTIRDFYSKNPIASATIQLKKVKKVFINGNYTYQQFEYGGLTTDSLGQYKMVVAADEYVVEVSRVGYISKSRFVNLRKNALIDFELSEKINQLDNVEVRTKSAESNVKSVEISAISINLQSLKRTPVVFGESDIIRSLTLQPGVTNAGEGAGGFSVRGGRIDQNLILLDDAPLFNTSHLLGLFTSLNAEAVQTATLYKNGISARYGGRLSSLLNMNSRIAQTQKRTAVSVGPVSSNALLERSFAHDRGAVMVAVRGAYPTWLLNFLPTQVSGSKAAFFDGNLSLRYRFNARNALILTAYQSTDNFKFPEDTSYFWRSQVATLQWSSQPTKRLSGVTKAILSHYTYGINGLSEGFGFRFTAQNRHHELRSDWLWQVSEKQRLEYGLNAINYRFWPGLTYPTEAQSAVNTREIESERALESAAYVSYDWTPLPKVSIQAGLRYAHFMKLGGYQYLYMLNQPKAQETITDTLNFESNKIHFQRGGWEPRFLVKVELGEYQSLKFGYNRTRQFLHLITNTTAIAPVDYWKLSNPYLPPQQAHQWSLGYYQNFRDNEYISNVEGFYKTMTGMMEYKDGASLFLNPHLETELIPAIGQAYGVEFSLQKTKGRLLGFANYTWSRSWLAARSVFAIEQINQGNYYASIFDKPHNLNLSGQYYIGSGWTLSANFIYQTGRPLTYPDGQYVFNNNLIFNYSSRYASRLPDYHRLDLSLSRDSRRTKEQRRYSILNLSLYNVYARRNPFSIFFKQYFGYPKSYRLSVLGTLVPSINLTQYF